MFTTLAGVHAACCRLFHHWFFSKILLILFLFFFLQFSICLLVLLVLAHQVVEVPICLIKLRLLHPLVHKQVQIGFPKIYTSVKTSYTTFSANCQEFDFLFSITLN